MKPVFHPSVLLTAVLATLMVGSTLPAQAQTEAIAPASAPAEMGTPDLAPPILPPASEATVAPQTVQTPPLLSEVKENNAALRSAAPLAAATTTPAATDAPAAAPAAADSNLVAQDIDPGRATRSGSSYLGIAGNIGLTGNSSDLGRSSFAVISKIGLTNVLSLRPAVFINQNTTINIPLTFDYAQRDPADVGFTVAPYFGGGISIVTGSDSRVGPLLTTGLDIPISRELTATAGLNLAFVRNTDLGLFIGVGYNFSGF